MNKLTSTLLLMVNISPLVVATRQYDLHIYPLSNAAYAYGINSRPFLLYTQQDPGGGTNRYGWDVLQAPSGIRLENTNFQLFFVIRTDDANRGIGFGVPVNFNRYIAFQLQADGLHEITLDDRSIDQSTVNVRAVGTNTRGTITGDYWYGDFNSSSLYRLLSDKTFQTLAPPTGGKLTALGIAQDDTVVGVQKNPSPPPVYVGVLWPKTGDPTIILPFGGPNLLPAAISNRTVIGQSTVAQDGATNHAFAYDRQSSIMTDLQPLASYSNSSASALWEASNQTVVAGTSYVSQPTAGEATVWPASGPPVSLTSLILQELGGRTLTTVSAGSDSGLLAGSYQNPDGTTGIFIADPVDPSEMLGDLDGDGGVRSSDLNTMFRFLLGLEKPYSFRQRRAVFGIQPLDFASTVQASDVVREIRRILGIEPPARVLSP